MACKRHFTNRPVPRRPSARIGKPVPPAAIRCTEKSARPAIDRRWPSQKHVCEASENSHRNASTNPIAGASFPQSRNSERQAHSPPNEKPTQEDPPRTGDLVAKDKSRTRIKTYGPDQRKPTFTTSGDCGGEITTDGGDDERREPTDDKRRQRKRARGKGLSRHMETKPPEECGHQQRPEHRQKKKGCPAIKHCSTAPAGPSAHAPNQNQQGDKAGDLNNL